MFLVKNYKQCCVKQFILSNYNNLYIRKYDIINIVGGT